MIIETGSLQEVVVDTLIFPKAPQGRRATFCSPDRQPLARRGGNYTHFVASIPRPGLFLLENDTDSGQLAKLGLSLALQYCV